MAIHIDRVKAILLEVRKIKVSEKSERILWSISFPGFGQILNGQILKGIIFITLEFMVNIMSNLNMSIIYSLQGNINAAINNTDYYWLMFYPCIYMFSMWDAYKNIDNDSSYFMFLPFAFAAIFSTIGVAWSSTFRVFGFLLGPVWLPIIAILLGCAFGLLVKEYLIIFKKPSKTINSEQTKYRGTAIDEIKFEDRYPYIEQLAKSEFTGIAVYSLPDLVLVKANQTYLNFLEPPINESSCIIGKRIDEIVAGWKGSPIEQYWKDAIEAGKSFRVSEHIHKEYSSGITYWDSIVTPVMENGKAKYVVSNARDVTETVMSRKKVEAQMELISSKNKQLEAVIESAGDILVLIDRDGNVLKQSSIFDETTRSTVSELYENIEPPSNVNINEETFNRVLKNGERVKGYKTKKVQDGRIIYTVTNGVPVFNSKEEVELGVFTTVTVTEKEEKRASI